MIFRKAILSDLKEMQELFVETIRSVCKKDYNPEQIEVWVSGAKITQRWIDVVNSQFVLLAIIEDTIVGYGTIKDGNYIDFFFIHKNFQRQGIADKIFSQLELEARKENSKLITADVSITAKPYFEKKGFIVKSEQKNIIAAVEIINYKMEKTIDYK
jgi:putative acetyltransferase